MATQTIDATLFASSHPDIVKRTSVSGLIFSPVKHGVNVRVCNNGNHDRGEG